jgi:hypothetical protein
VKSIGLTCLALVLVSVGVFSAAQGNTERYYPLLTSAEPNGAPVDTIYLIGEPGSGTGDFQSGLLNDPDLEGWTSVDRTRREISKWHIDTFNAELLDDRSPNHALYCGEVFTPCSTEDTPEGYGNNYEEYVDWWGTVSNMNAPTIVTVSGILNYDNESGYDYLYLRNEDSNGWNDVTYWNGTNLNTTTLVFEPVSFTFPIHYAANTYVGAGFNEVHLRFSAESDAAWSDDDCLWPSSGLAQIDNIEVDGDNSLISTYDDFETDLESSAWKLTLLHGVGNFGQVWPFLDDIDPCRYNNTPQVAFIDDGIIEDCDGEKTLGTVGQNFTYGPNGYCVNQLGGCLGPRYMLHNEIWSPIIDWPQGDHDGIELSYDVFSHFDPFNGILSTWGVRFMDQDLNWSRWQTPTYYPDLNYNYTRLHIPLTEYGIDNPRAVRIALGAKEFVYPVGWNYIKNTPAPYIDNVALRVFPVSGPMISADAVNLAQDGFPSSGAITGDPNDLSIRFDMSLDIADDWWPTIVPGDSITFTIKPVRSGSSLHGNPKLHYALHPNPDLTVTRFFALQDSVDCAPAFDGSGNQVADIFCVDLPDTGFLFPGDVLHYYISAEDIIDGAPSTVTRSTLPFDLTGFGVFDERPVPHFASDFTVHGLPALHEIDDDWHNGYTQPEILLWDDGELEYGAETWMIALAQLGLYRGVDYDVFRTVDPSAHSGNGLGARATPPQMDGYATLMYSSGDQPFFTLGFGSMESGEDKSPDIPLLDAWLRTGGRSLMMTGNHLLYGILSDSSEHDFIPTWLGTNYYSNDVSHELNSERPGVIALSGTSIPLPADFFAMGGCPDRYRFDRARLSESTISLANFTNATGSDSGIPAVTYRDTLGSRVVYSCVDFSLWGTPYDKSATSARAQNLAAILDVFGQTATGPATDTPGIIEFFTRNHPNPFNPATRISFSVPQAGQVSVKIYNLRGELVRTLVDDVMPVSALVTREWLGRDDKGRDAASGVYFYKVKTKGHGQTKKMALIR